MDIGIIHSKDAESKLAAYAFHLKIPDATIASTGETVNKERMYIIGDCGYTGKAIIFHSHKCKNEEHIVFNDLPLGVWRYLFKDRNPPEIIERYGESLNARIAIDSLVERSSFEQLTDSSKEELADRIREVTTINDIIVRDLLKTVCYKVIRSNEIYIIAYINSPALYNELLYEKMPPFVDALVSIQYNPFNERMTSSLYTEIDELREIEFKENRLDCEHLSSLLLECLLRDGVAKITADELNEGYMKMLKGKFPTKTLSVDIVL